LKQAKILKIKFLRKINFIRYSIKIFLLNIFNKLVNIDNTVCFKANSKIFLDEPSITFNNIIKLRLLSLFDKLDNNNNTDFSSNGEKVFLEHLFNYFVKFAKSDLVIFDIGSNIGNYANMLYRISLNYKTSLEIHCFEPTVSCFNELVDKYSDNNTFILNNLACSNKSGSSIIYYDEEKSGLASLYKRDLNHFSIKLDKFEKIQKIRLDSYISTKEISHIDFMKIDVEGHELEVLEGLGNYLNNDFIDFIQFEYGGCNLDSKTRLLDFFNIFEQKGFIICKIMPIGLEIRKFEYWMENFQYSNFVAIPKKIINFLK